MERLCTCFNARRKHVVVALLGVVLLFQSFLALTDGSLRLRGLNSYTARPDSQTRARGRNETRVSQDRSISTRIKRLTQKLDSYNDTLSICLLTKDDNHILPEWLAYHYHVANLRTLIVMVDPTSNKYPTDILNRYRNLLDIEILEWKDKDIMPENMLNSDGILDRDRVMDYRKQHLKPIKNKWLRDQVVNKYLTENVTEREIRDAVEVVAVHRYRQEFMATECVNHLRESGRSWVSILDSDEYMRIGNSNGFDPSIVPTMKDPGAVMKWINTMYSNETACFKMPWYRHGATDESSAEALSQSIPDGFDPKQFMTLRWRFHNGAERNGKDCLNLQRAASGHFPLQKITNVHMLADPICGSSFSNTKRNPIAIGHYAGTWDSYSRRDDVRRSKARLDYERKAAANAIADDDTVASWFNGFVSIHGTEKAEKLLGEPYLRDTAR